MNDPNKLSGLWRKYITASVVLDKPTPYVKIHGIDEFNAAVAQLLLEARIEELTEALQMNGVHPGDWEVAIHQRIAELKALGGVNFGLDEGKCNKSSDDPQLGTNQ